MPAMIAGILWHDLSKNGSSSPGFLTVLHQGLSKIWR